MTGRPLVRLAHTAVRRARGVGADRSPSFCENVRAWAADVLDTDSTTVLPPRRVKRNLPHTIEPEIDSAYVTCQDVSQREKYVVPIAGARIVGGIGLIVLPDGSYSSESVYARRVLEEDSDYRSRKQRPTISKPGTYFSLVDVWTVRSGGIYYHWLHDTLERLVGVLDLLPQGTKFIVPDDLKPFQLETLRLVGIEEELLVRYSGNEVWELERLYFSPPTSNSGSHRRDADLWLRDRLMEALKVPRAGRAPARRRLFVSRRNMKGRRITNEEEVEAILRDRGFETLMPETLSLRRQVELFAEASVIVSTHGSAFTNILFSPPGLVVLDMVPPSMLHTAYVFWSMSEELDHQYWYLAAADSGTGSVPDTYVPCEKLAATLERMSL